LRVVGVDCAKAIPEEADNRVIDRAKRVMEFMFALIQMRG
jgi:hypothetical protein